MACPLTPTTVAVAGRARLRTCTCTVAPGNGRRGRRRPLVSGVTGEDRLGDAVGMMAALARIERAALATRTTLAVGRRGGGRRIGRRGGVGGVGGAAEEGAADGTTGEGGTEGSVRHPHDPAHAWSTA